ncbi:cyclin-dependent kinase 10-like [Daphnia magna]|uniref:cyclin-dependent kinase 10-like n=1 Tax=Daphnia magna TaxID=35525 RepID=UPI001403A14A|nr:cyclin-dependent kinase 10-like [Daphnia magna]
MQKYEKLEKIGEGTYGTVFKAKNRENQEIVALKRVRLDDDDEVNYNCWRKIFFILHSLLMLGCSIQCLERNMLIKRAETSQHSSIT